MYKALYINRFRTCILRIFKVQVLFLSHRGGTVTEAHRELAAEVLGKSLMEVVKKTIVEAEGKSLRELSKEAHEEV